MSGGGGVRPAFASHREAQDLVIRALADSGFRASRTWRELDLADGDRVERFARFLTRRFYHTRIVHLFSHTRALAPITGRTPEEVVRGPAFEGVLAAAVLGSRETAAEVAALVRKHVGAAPGARLVPYLDDLLRYEEAMMVAESGPRDRKWEREEATRAVAAEVGEGDVPEVSPSCAVVRTAHDLTRALPRLAGRCASAPPAPHRPTWFVVGRTPAGRVSSSVVAGPVVRALRHADGRRTVAQIAERTAVAPRDLARTFSALSAAGAIRVRRRGEPAGPSARGP